MFSSTEFSIETSDSEDFELEAKIDDGEDEDDEENDDEDEVAL